MQSTEEIVSRFEKEKSSHWPQYFAVFTASLALLTSGLHFGWPSASVPKMLSEDYKFSITTEEASYIVIVGPLGDVVSSPLAGLLVDVIGRKTTLLLIAVPQIVSLLMIYFSDLSYILLYTGRFIGGMAEGACFSVLPIYIGEVSEPAIRGLLGSYISVTLILGIFLSNIIGSILSLHTAALVYIILPICFIFIFWRMPETPYYLIMKNQENIARESLRTLRRKTDVEDELSSITGDVRRQMSERGTFKDLFTIKSNRRACIIMLGIRSAQQFSGIAAYTLYAQVMFNDAMDGFSPFLASAIFIGTQLVSTCFIAFFVDKFGRKILLIISCSICCGVLTIQCVYFAFRDFSSCDVTFFSWLPLVGMVIYVGSFAIGLGTVVNLMPSELFSASIKAKAVYIMNMYYAITMLVTVKFFQYTLEWFGIIFPIAIFSVCAFLGILFCYFYVPETKGKTLEEIQQYLKGHQDVKSNNDIST